MLRFLLTQTSIPPPRTRYEKLHGLPSSGDSVSLLGVPGAIKMDSALHVGVGVLDRIRCRDNFGPAFSEKAISPKSHSPAS